MGMMTFSLMRMREAQKKKAQAATEQPKEPENSKAETKQETKPDGQAKQEETKQENSVSEPKTDGKNKGGKKLRDE